jgi:alpha-methylacyl-CoA racemase
MLLAVGLLAGLLEAQRSGRGQVVDAAMIDGAALLMAQSFALLAAGLWSEERGGNRLDGGAPFYAAYETSDSRYIAVGAIERKFYEQLLDLLGLADESLPDQMDRSGWPALTERFAEIFRRRTRDEWVEAAAGREACLTPVLTLAEAPQHAHHVERGTYVVRDGVVQPAPAPRFSRTPGAIDRGPSIPGEHTREALDDWGFDTADIDELVASGAAVEAV